MNFMSVFVKLVGLVLWRMTVVGHPYATLIAGCIASAVCTGVVKNVVDRPNFHVAQVVLLIVVFIVLWFVIMCILNNALHPRRIDLNLNERIDYLDKLCCYHGSMEEQLHEECSSFSKQKKAKVKYSYKYNFDEGGYKYYDFSDHVISRFKKLTNIDATVTMDGTEVTFAMK